MDRDRRREDRHDNEHMGYRRSDFSPFGNDMAGRFNGDNYGSTGSGSYYNRGYDREQYEGGYGHGPYESRAEDRWTGERGYEDQGRSYRNEEGPYGRPGRRGDDHRGFREERSYKGYYGNSYGSGQRMHYDDRSENYGRPGEGRGYRERRGRNMNDHDHRNEDRGHDMPGELPYFDPWL